MIMILLVAYRLRVIVAAKKPTKTENNDPPLRLTRELEPIAPCIYMIMKLHAAPPSQRMMGNMITLFDLAYTTQHL